MNKHLPRLRNSKRRSPGRPVNHKKHAAGSKLARMAKEKRLTLWRPL